MSFHIIDIKQYDNGWCYCPIYALAIKYFDGVETKWLFIDNSYECPRFYLFQDEEIINNFFSYIIDEDTSVEECDAFFDQIEKYHIDSFYSFPLDHDNMELEDIFFNIKKANNPDAKKIMQIFLSVIELEDQNLQDALKYIKNKHLTTIRLNKLNWTKIKLKYQNPDLYYQDWEKEMEEIVK